MSVRSVFPRHAVIQSATPADRTSRRSSSVVLAHAYERARVCVCVRENGVRENGQPKKEGAAEALPRRTRRQCKEVGDRASGWVAGHNNKSSAVESEMTCSVHSPSAGGARFTGRTDPLSRGADYISSASYARRR